MITVYTTWNQIGSEAAATFAFRFNVINSGGSFFSAVGAHPAPRITNLLFELPLGGSFRKALETE